MGSLESLRKRLKYQGGTQEERMIKDKYKSFDKALSYSYQSAEVQKDKEDVVRALINPDKTKTDYDDKIISIDYAHGYKCGDIFKWIGTNTYWIIYIEQLTEDAYFRGEIRRCKYQIQWINTEKEEREWTWAYIRGQVETKINAIQKSGISVDTPNNSLEIYVPNNEQNLNKFKRYEKFLFDDMAWEVSVVDRISIDGVIQIVAVEHYIDTVKDDREKNLVNAFQVLPILPEIEEVGELIDGPDTITPTIPAIYSSTLALGSWSVKEGKRPIKVIAETDNSITIEWVELLSGNFTLVYTVDGNTYEKFILVESLL